MLPQGNRPITDFYLRTTAVSASQKCLGLSPVEPGLVGCDSQRDHPPAYGWSYFVFCFPFSSNVIFIFYFFLFAIQCVYMCVRARTCVCMRVCRCKICEYASRGAKGGCQAPCSVHLHFMLLRQDLFLNLESDCPATLPPLHPHMIAKQSVLGNSSALGHTQLFTWVLASKLWSSSFYSKHCCPLSRLFSLNNVTFYCTLINNQLQALISASRSSADRRNTTAPGCS